MNTESSSNSRINWSELYQARRSVQSRYRKIWDLPIAKRYSTVLERHGRDGVALLEVGAGGRGLEKRIKSWWPSASYKSFDIDPATRQDFHRLEDISGSYDLVCMFEVIEHVRPEAALEILKKCFEVTKPGGLLFVTTPNIYYPPNYLRDATHITPWCYDELGGVLLWRNINYAVYTGYSKEAYSIPYRIGMRLPFPFCIN